MKTVCIGDSLVEGYPYFGGHDFPSEIGRITGEETVNLGISGQSSGEISERFDAVFDHDPDSVLILCGSNDFIFSVCDPEKTMENIASMAASAAARGLTVILCSPILCDPIKASMQWADIPPEGYHRINKKLMSLRKMILRQCAVSGYVFLDLQSFYIGIAEYEDGVHPTEDGYRAIGAEAAKKISEIAGQIVSHSV